MNRPKPHDELELEVDNLAFGGKGVARLDGFVIFVSGAVPGDKVRALITKSKRSFAEARVLEILSASSERCAPACQYFGVCGGCAWQTLSYPTQLFYKQKQVNECLAHIGGLEQGFTTDEAIGAEPLWRYRNKVEFTFAPGPGGPELGFHLLGQWRQVIDIEDCLLHSELTNRIRNRVRQLVRKTGVGVYDQRQESGFWRHLVLKEGTNTGEVMVNIVTAAGEFPDRKRFARELSQEFPQIKSLLWSINDSKAAVANGYPFTVLAGNDHIHEHLCGLELKVSPASFLQTNTAMAKRLYQRALEYSGLSGDEYVFDLYSGIGSISLLLARSAQEVLGIEIGGEAVAMAEENARLNQIGNASFIAGKVRATLKGFQPHRPPALVVLDPPRAGASQKEIQRIIELGAPRVVYVSCNASTLASNASQLVEAGYRLKRVGAVDMFPHTPHIEVVSQFERSH